MSDAHEPPPVIHDMRLGDSAASGETGRKGSEALRVTTGRPQ